MAAKVTVWLFGKVADGLVGGSIVTLFGYLVVLQLGWLVDSFVTLFGLVAAYKAVCLVGCQHNSW